MKTHIVLAGHDIARLVEISAALDPVNQAHLIAQTDGPLHYLSSHPRYAPKGGVVEMAGTENVAEVQEMLSRQPETGFVFLIDQMPPSAAMARVAGTQAVFLDKQDSALAISATLVSLLYQREFAERHDE